MKKNLGLVLAGLLLASVFNLQAGSYQSYLELIGKAGKPSNSQKIAAINQLIANPADQNNCVILDLLINKILNIRYQDLAKLDLSQKLVQILNKLPELSASAGDSTSSTPIATPSLPASSSPNILDKYTKVKDRDEVLFLILSNPNDLFNVTIVEHLINRLKLTTYNDLIKMSLMAKVELLLGTESESGTGAGTSLTGAGVETSKPTGGPAFLGGLGSNPMAGLKKTSTPSTTVTAPGSGAGTSMGSSIPAGMATTSPAMLKPAVGSIFGTPMAGAGAGAGTGTGAGTSTVASETLTREQQEKDYFESFSAPSSIAVSNLDFYERLQNDHTTPEEITNQKIMAALFAPQKVTNELISDRSRITSEMGISNEAVLDFLLRDRFNQNPETVRQMILQDKQIGLVRFLLPYAIRQRVILPKIGTGDIGYVEYPSPVNKDGTKTMYVRGKTLTNSYRHLDFKPDKDELWLINRHVFGDIRFLFGRFLEANDYALIQKPGTYKDVTYTKISNFYWMPDGETFILIYNDGKSGTYRGVDGELIGELREPIIMEIPSAAEIPATPTGFNNKGQAVQIAGETTRHFRARLRAKLNEFEARSISGRDSSLIRAMAILTLDKSFTGLTDDNITSLENISEDDALLTSKLDEIATKDPNSLSLLEQAIVYYAIKQAKISAESPLFAQWNESFNEMDLAVIAGQNTQGASGIPADAITNRSQLAGFVAEATIRYPLNETEKGQLRRPVSYTNKTAIAELIAKSPTSATNLDKAKAYFLIKANIVKSSDPKVVEWRSVLNI